MRLLVWNIQKFTSRVFERHIREDGPGLNEEYLLEIVAATHPDIFVVIEVQSTHGVIGSLIDGRGKDGVLYLLQEIRTMLGGHWMLVPPLRLNNHLDQGHTEGIAVYYNNNTLDFRGPFFWNAQTGVADPDAINGGQYPQLWRGCLPQGNTRAGKFEFDQAMGGETQTFPDPGNRPPFRTDFRERGGTQRTIKLFSVHLPPRRKSTNLEGNLPTEKAALAMGRLNGIADIYQMQQNQIIVFAGDFNYDQRPTVQHSPMSQVGYNLFRQMVTPAIAWPTMLASANEATLDGNHPAYGYLRDICLDNIYYAYMDNTQQVNPKNPTVINGVIGGGNGYDLNIMMDSIPDILAMDMFDGDPEGRDEQFRLPENYGHIGHGRQGLSDHLPIVIDL